MEELQKACQKYLNMVSSPELYQEDHHDKWTEPILEIAMKLALGEDVWDRFNAEVEKREIEIYGEDENE